MSSSGIFFDLILLFLSAFVPLCVLLSTQWCTFPLYLSTLIMMDTDSFFWKHAAPAQQH